MTPQLLHGDCLTVLPTLGADSIDAIVTDPPYGLAFMGKAWDHGVPGEPFWREALRVAKPGAHLVAFGGTRTYHRLACAIEDAGWEIRDCLMWLYGSGFPKSHNGPWGGTALKPAWEPIILARKPLSGTTVAQTVQAYGTGAINVDGCRIGTDEDRSRPRGSFPHSDDAWGNGRLTHTESNPTGRWPANLLLDEDSAAVLNGQAGERGAGGKLRVTTANEGRADESQYRIKPTAGTVRDHGDTGGPSRFFYCAKASRKDREAGNTHPTVKPTDLMRWLVRLVTPPGGTVLDPFMGSGSTGKAAGLEGRRFIGIEREASYLAIAAARCGVPLTPPTPDVESLHAHPPR